MGTIALDHPRRRLLVSNLPLRNSNRKTSQLGHLGGMRGRSHPRGDRATEKAFLLELGGGSCQPQKEGEKVGSDKTEDCFGGQAGNFKSRQRKKVASKVTWEHSTTIRVKRGKQTVFTKTKPGGTTVEEQIYPHIRRHRRGWMDGGGFPKERKGTDEMGTN